MLANADDIYDKYKQIDQSAQTHRNLLVKFHFNHAEKELNKVIEGLDQVVEKERVILEAMAASIL